MLEATFAKAVLTYSTVKCERFVPLLNDPSVLMKSAHVVSLLQDVVTHEIQTFYQLLLAMRVSVARPRKQHVLSLSSLLIFN